MDKIKQKKLNLSTSSDPLTDQTPSSARGNGGGGPRQLTRASSLKNLSQKSDNRVAQEDYSYHSKPLSSLKRRGSKNSIAIDISEATGIVDQDGGTGCCNMKLSDLKQDRQKAACYNPFEASIIEQRKAHKAKFAGRSIESIRKKPSVSTISRFASSGMSLRAVTMITDNIMLGGKEDAEDAALLLEYGVTHILNTAQQLPNYFPQSFVYLKLSLLDAATTNMAEAMESAVSFLSHVENLNGRVLIHCLAGVSRSVTLLLMHLIVRHRIPLQSAFRYVRSCRPQINPNDSFKLQLARLEVQELRYSSVAKDADKAWDFYDWNSVKRSVPSAPVEDDSPGRDKGGHRSAEDLVLLQQQQAGRERQLSISSIGDAICCTIS